MLILKRPPVNKNNDDEHYETQIQRQAKTGKNSGTLRNYNYLPIGSTAAVQRKDKEYQSHSDGSYRIHVKKMGWLIMGSNKHVNAVQISSKLYLRDQLSKDRTTDTLEHILKQFEDTHLTVTETSTQYTTWTETNSNYTLSPTTNS